MKKDYKTIEKIVEQLSGETEDIFCGYLNGPDNVYYDNKIPYAVSGFCVLYKKQCVYDLKYFDFKCCAGKFKGEKNEK